MLYIVYALWEKHSTFPFLTVAHISIAYLLFAMLASHITHQAAMKRVLVPPQTWHGMQRSCQEINNKLQSCPNKNLPNMIENSWTNGSHLDLCRINCFLLTQRNSTVQRAAGGHFRDRKMNYEETFGCLCLLPPEIAYQTGGWPRCGGHAPPPMRRWGHGRAREHPMRGVRKPHEIQLTAGKYAKMPLRGDLKTISLSHSNCASQLSSWLCCCWWDKASSETL